DLTRVQARELPLRSPAGAERDGQLPLQQDEEGVDGHTLLDEDASRRHEPLLAGAEHPLHVVVVELAEEEEDFAHGEAPIFQVHASCRSARRAKGPLLRSSSWKLPCSAT